MKVSMTPQEAVQHLWTRTEQLEKQVMAQSLLLGAVFGLFDKGQSAGEKPISEEAYDNIAKALVRNFENEPENETQVKEILEWVRTICRKKPAEILPFPTQD